MKILVCDDDPALVRRIAAQITRHCESSGRSVALTEVTDPTRVDAAEEFDLAFLDVDMPQLSGLELARSLHAHWPNTVLVFVTHYVQYAPDGYEVGAFRYLIKSSLPEKLPQYLELAIQERVRRRRTVTIQINGEHIAIPVSQILYMESRLRTITLHLLESPRASYQFYGSLADLEQRFEILGFLRVHKSYLVNMEHIELFQCSRLELQGGVVLPCSEKRYPELKQQYLKWEARSKWSIC